MGEFVIKRRDKEEGSSDRYKTIQDVSKYGAVTITKDKFIKEMPKPKEYIKCTPELVDKLRSMVHLDNNMLMADIFASGTIPCNNVLFEDIYSDTDDGGQTWKISAHVFVCDNPETIIESLDGPDDITTIGIIRVDATNLQHTGVTKHVDIAIRLRYDWNIDWFPLISMSEHEFDKFKDYDYNTALSYMVHIKDMVFITWYGLQLALLNPVIKERIHRETVPMAEVKAGNNKKKKAKTVKRYVKRITVDDLSDIEIADPKHHNMTKSYWWVTGHWRNQKTKDGHIRKFIKGYWKGPMREIADELGYEPYERKVIL